MKKLITILILTITTTLMAQIDHVEPPFWWENMNRSNIQILVHGKNISGHDVKIEGLPVLEVLKDESPNYLFVTVGTKGAKPGMHDIQFQLNGITEFVYPFEIKERRRNSPARSGFDASDAMYLLMPDRFANGNPENDSVEGLAEKANRENKDGRHGGDIQGIINNLDYLEDLGITALWSTPLLEDNEPNYSYHHYAQSDYYKIDARYGTNEDYQRLATEMHKRKMKLVMDYVTNHWGSKHWLINDLPAPDWIHVWPEGENGFKRSNYRMTTQFDQNAAKIDAIGCMDGWFDTTMPDMNQKNPLLLNYMIQNAIWWIEYADLDGLRVDTYSYNDKEAIAKWTEAIMSEYPAFNIVGEVWMHNQAQIAYWQKDSKIAEIEGYNSHLPSVMDFTLHDALISMFGEGAGWDSGLQKAYDNFANDFLYPDINNMLVFVGNHDTNRFNTIYKQDLATYKLAMTMILTVRGIPQLYYGDEIGMTGDKEKNGDGDIRQDFPGGWAGDAQNAFTQEGRSASQNEYHNFTKKILNWRKGNKAMHTGKFLHYIPFDDVYVYFRYDDKDRVMVVLNNSNEEKTIKMDRFIEGLNGSKKGKNILNDEKVELIDKLVIGGKSSMIIELN